MKALVIRPGDENFDDTLRENFVECVLLAYDRDKYVLCQMPDGTQSEFKSGYIKQLNMKELTQRNLFSLPVWHVGSHVGKKRTKRSVQQELKENYKLKTTFTLYVSNNVKGLDTETKVLKTDTLKKAIRIFRKYFFSQLLVSDGRWNKVGIAERDNLISSGFLFYDLNNKNRPTYSAKAIRELDK